MSSVCHRRSRSVSARRCLQFGVLALAVAGALLLANSALAGWWFYQGNLPTSGGTVLLGSNPPAAVYQEVSWTGCTHSMYLVQVEYNGSWDLITETTSGGCDHTIMVQYPDLHNNYGCENPPGLSTVYTNCRAAHQ
jgi:hypothetical protein